jgi:hypothetical protein
VTAGPCCSQILVVAGSGSPFAPVVATLVSAGRDETTRPGTPSCPQSWAFPVATSVGNQ